MQELVTGLSESCIRVANDLNRNCVPPSTRSAKTRRVALLLAGCSVAAALVGCGGGSMGRPDFAVEVAPSAIAVIQGGGVEKFKIATAPVNGFSEKVMLSF